MIVIIARIDVKPGERNRVIELAQPCLEGTRREDGCISYELMAHTDHPDNLVFVEQWRDKAALHAHFDTPHLKAFKEARDPYVNGPSKLSIFEAVPTEA